MLQNWLKIAFTNYRKNWLVSLINLLGLTIGFSIFLLVYLNWQDEKSYENWVPGKENIYFVENGNSVFGKMGVSSYPELYVSKEKFSEIEDYTIANIWGVRARLIYKNQSAYTTSAWAVDSYFEFFPYEKVAGSFKNAISDEGKIALSEETAKTLFGSAYKDCIGKIIKTDNDDKSYVITVVYRLPSSNSVFKPGSIIKQRGLEEAKNTWTSYSYMGFFKVKPGTDIENLEKKLTVQLANAEKIDTEKWGEKYNDKDKTEVSLVPLSKMKLDAESDGIKKADKKSMMILLSLSVLILILSGINLINLKTAQASQRAKEVGVRKAMGSSKWMIVGQFIFENAIICIAAYLLSLVVLEVLLPSYNKFLGKEMMLRNTNAILYSVFLLLTFILISGIIPALYLSNFKPINTLKGNFSGSKHGVWLRNAILTVQLVISSFFIICSFIVHTQVGYMMNKELGFNGDQVIQIDFKKSNYEDDYTYKKYLRLKNEVLKISGVEDVTGSVLSIGIGVSNSSSVKNAQDTTKVLNNVVNGGIDYNFFNFYKIKFVAGRDLDIRKASDTMSGVVANEAFVKEIGWNNQQALGKEIYPGWGSKKKYKIIGVIKDFYVNGVDKPVESMLFYNYDRTSLKNGMNNLQIKLSGNDINGTLERIEKFWNTEAEPGYPFEYSFVDKNFAKTFDKYKEQRMLFTILNSVVLIVALLGLFALSSLMIEQKLKDVAIKKTLGASDGVLIIDLTRKFLWITALAVLLSIPVSYYFMNEWLKDFAYRIEMPWWPYILSLIILLLLTFLVVSIKAYRATKVELVRYLKYE
ncbi:antibiotic ABC transporter permease [Elizabethkingia meningoseptica]|uniref:ABC transporter permease n=1 Tax=Elizabethkingia meningoseptica TaxID=238 RepID=UPI000332C429|nr:ABC transporter permease [Elizabethkingia meningoseptica]AQX05232.1 antibiotic ABC transporter permease [Elizabethkingia meningoseptica]AQX47277.1 antibiotic ABC transporter permease [Elizabethkingia meningoseptica]EOR31062.1 antimicrobial peptide ABC transporter permease [Elizabethkingia meningoseptica ATCC 13253 = NBRC 12535]KUY21802.1 antibiotic ABC transporter permease [Elizabethkingia meningoseptica]MEC4712130.1 FtsX-like permease family protein [Elizabethkingia meningoseptica]